MIGWRERRRMEKLIRKTFPETPPPGVPVSFRAEKGPDKTITWGAAPAAGMLRHRRRPLPTRLRRAPLKPPAPKPAEARLQDILLARWRTHMTGIPATWIEGLPVVEDDPKYEVDLDADLAHHKGRSAQMPELFTARGWVPIDELIEVARVQARREALREVQGEVAKTLHRAVSDYTLKAKRIDKIEKWCRDAIAASGTGGRKQEIRADAAREIRRLLAETWGLR